MTHISLMVCVHVSHAHTPVWLSSAAQLQISISPAGLSPADVLKHRLNVENELLSSLHFVIPNMYMFSDTIKTICILKLGIKISALFQSVSSYSREGYAVFSRDANISLMNKKTSLTIVSVQLNHHCSYV